MKIYTCPMHPSVNQFHPGSCPICGMALEPALPQETEAEDPEYKDMLKRFIIAAVLSVPLLILAMGDMFIDLGYLGSLLQLILATPIVLWAGWPFFVKGWQSLRTGNLNMFSLIALGIGVAYIYSVIVFLSGDYLPEVFKQEGEAHLYFESSAIITVLVLLGQVLELRSRSKTGLAIKALLGQEAKTARLLVNGEEKEVPLEDVHVGDLLRVKPGDRIAVDGSIVDGDSSINEAMITGEAFPVEKKAGDSVIGGTINQTGTFVMKAEKIGHDTLLSRIIHLVSEAQRSKAPIQSLADKVSSYFVPIVIGIALITFFGWYFWGPAPALLYAIMNSVAVLIIACPCALGLATPMSVVVGMGKGAESGVLFKNAAALEKMSSVKTVVVDKTGTLTEGKPVVTDVIRDKAVEEKELILLAAAAEKNSEHPLAQAILGKAKDFNLKLPPAASFSSVPGGGVAATIQEKKVVVGKNNYLSDLSIQNVDKFEEKARDFQIQARTSIFVAVDGKAVGMLAISDPIRSSSFQAVQELSRMGIAIEMLSGDNTFTAKAVGDRLGITEIRAGVDPSKKQEYIRELQEEGQLVAMAGDGINDAPALAAADVGIAMGSGTDVAIESADVTLVKGNLMGIVKAFHLSKAMMKNIRQNLFLAFIYNILAIPIAAGVLYPFTGVLLDPIIAALAMSLSSVSVISNSLRLRNLKL